MCAQHRACVRASVHALRGVCGMGGVGGVGVGVGVGVSVCG